MEWIQSKCVNGSLLQNFLKMLRIIKNTPIPIHPNSPFFFRLYITFNRDSEISDNITSKNVHYKYSSPDHNQEKWKTCWEKISRVLCPLVSIAAATKTALETLRGNNSIEYDIHAPPKSCPTKITCVRTRKKVRYARKEYSADSLFSKLDSKIISSSEECNEWDNDTFCPDFWQWDFYWTNTI